MIRVITDQNMILLDRSFSNSFFKWLNWYDLFSVPCAAVFCGVFASLAIGQFSIGLLPLGSSSFSVRVVVEMWEQNNVGEIVC